MKITYDNEADALYIYLLPVEREKTAVRVNEHVILDYGPADELAGIEILDASEVLHFDRNKPQVSIDKAMEVVPVS